MTRWTEEQFREAQKNTRARQMLDAMPMGKPPSVISNGIRYSVRINLPFPPTVNHIWQSSGKRRYLSKEYEAFLGMVQVIVARAGIPRFDKQRLAVVIQLHWPNKRRGDIDNRVKAVLDSLGRCKVFDDDEQVDSLVITRENIVKGGLCVVTLEALP